MAAIQGLNQKVEAQRAELKQKQLEFAQLKQSMAELKQRVGKLAGERNRGVQ